jgi:hypothetical protein
MKIWLNAFGYLTNNARIAVTLLSGTCVGNDGKRCPLFHGSLAPVLFSVKKFSKFEKFLLLSNNITWVHTIYLFFTTEYEPNFNTSQLNGKIIKTLGNTRYSSRSLRNVVISTVCSIDINPFLRFVENHCTNLEHFEVLVHTWRLSKRAQPQFSFLSTHRQTLTSLSLDVPSYLSVPFEELTFLKTLKLGKISDAVCESVSKRASSLENLILMDASSITDRGLAYLQKPSTVHLYTSNQSRRFFRVCH